MRWLWIILLIAMALPAVLPWKRFKPMPRVHGNSVPVYLVKTSNVKVQQKIVNTHNHFRSQVKPSAANMLTVKWHRGLEKAAQRWADKCLGLMHDNATGLHLDGFGRSGQNIFISTERMLWNFVIRVWYMEYKDYKFGGKGANDYRKVGHYAQVVWAPTHLVGCGVSHCTGGKGPFGPSDFVMYVCNYAPGYTSDGLDRLYVPGKPCSMCENHCSRNKLCTNPCYYTNVWSNCAELVRTFRSWVCHTNTIEGRKRRESCGATCNCNGKIYDNSKSRP